MEITILITFLSTAAWCLMGVGVQKFGTFVAKRTEYHRLGDPMVIAVWPIILLVAFMADFEEYKLD